MNIQIHKLVKKYSDFTLSIPGLDITRGELIKLYGNNGAGKTTLLQALLDLIELDEGEITIDGLINTEFGDWKYQITSYFDESFLMTYLKVEEYFKLICSLYHKTYLEDKITKLAEDFFDYVQWKDKRISKLSSGNKLKVGILSTLITNSKLVILDEPLANLDPRSKIKFIELIQQYQKENSATIIISSHDIDITHRLKGRNIILDNGSIAYDQNDSPSSKKKIEDILYR